MPLPKKRKASDNNTNGSTPPTTRKKMTQSEKQEAWSRAQAWAEERKNTPAAASAAAVAGKKKAATPQKAASKKLTKQQQLKEAQERAAIWASNELKSPPPAPAVAPTIQKKKTLTQAKQTKSPIKKKSSVKEALSSRKESKSSEKKAAPNKKEHATLKKAPGRFFKAKLLVALCVMLVSVSLAICSSCQFLPNSLIDVCFDGCDIFEDVYDNARERLQGFAAKLLALRKKTDSSEWQECRIFWAPTKLGGSGYGMFAAQDFKENDLVELAPLYVPMESTAPAVKNTVLDDYIYGYIRDNGSSSGESMASVSLGYIMVNNHAVTPNVKWTGFGMEPNDDNDDVAKAIGFVAARDIKAGEELFSSYGLHDGGENWFQSRRLERKVASTEETMLSPNELEEFKAYHCSKTFAGYGRETFESAVLGGMPVEHRPGNVFRSLHPDQDAALGHVIAKVPMEPGDVAETAPGLLLRKSMVEGTALAPLTIRWDVLGGANRIMLRGLRDTGKLTVQTQGPDTDWKRVDSWNGNDNLAILSLGSIAMMARLGTNSQEANCRLEIIDSGSELGSATVLLRVVANRNIDVGDVLSIAMNQDATNDELELLFAEMEQTGQPL